METSKPSLWSNNNPRLFWQCQPDLSNDIWESAIAQAMPVLGLPENTPIDLALELTLGEGQFGSDHWSLSPTRRLYYVIKPFLPRTLTRALRRILQKRHKQNFELGWPIETRFARFQFVVLKNFLKLTGQDIVQIRAFWPHGKQYAFVITHDVESEKGQQFIRHVADLEESLGFRSSFNFVPQAYRIDMDLVNDLRECGFEIGIHGLKHDGKLFSSRVEFDRRVIKINHYLKELNAVGFRAPLMHRNPEWMQVLDIEYDLSFFDTDPLEPIPGGTMNIWPFFIGHFVELPYTLIQDYTLTDILHQTGPHLWLEKVEFIRQNRGMALINTHPDYLRDPSRFSIYAEFLHIMREKEDNWHALPREVARWWRDRTSANAEDAEKKYPLAIAVREPDDIQITNLPKSD